MEEIHNWDRVRYDYVRMFVFFVSLDTAEKYYEQVQFRNGGKLENANSESLVSVFDFRGADYGVLDVRSTWAKNSISNSSRMPE